MEILGYFAAILMGLSLGMIGGGGSILTVPILVYLFAVNPVLATAYSLFIVGLTSLVGGAVALKRGDVDLKTGFVFALPSFVGVYVTRAFVVPALPETIFQIGEKSLTKPLLIMIVFAILMVLASLSMIRSKKKGPEASEGAGSGGGAGQARRAWLTMSIVALEGLVVGGVTGFVGAGGGFLIIPALVVLIGLPMKVAVGTSLFIIASKSLIGFVGDLQNQPHIDWALLIALSVIAVFGLFLGMTLSKKVSDQALKKGFGYFVLIMGTLILIDQIVKL
ncbi:MAG: sulfite exporter TauE/SafE family protein [Bdellovibrionales bacterium]|jgi:uncharacterized membrane protein YfcA|nr:sulfite exporter TauE/SafE family protein [Bdellovibrionales bacterium]